MVAGDRAKNELHEPAGGIGEETEVKASGGIGGAKPLELTPVSMSPATVATELIEADDGAGLKSPTNAHTAADEDETPRPATKSVTQRTQETTTNSRKAPKKAASRLTNSIIAEIPEATLSPSRGKRKTSVSTKKRETPTLKTDNGDDMLPDDEDGGSPIKKRRVSARNAPSKKIPTSEAELTPQDRMMLYMRDEGKSWEDIRRMWKTITGEEVGRSSLPNRYARIKASISIFPEEYSAKLIRARKEVEEDFEKNKWNLIKACMDKLGVSDNYTITVLQKQWKKLESTNASELPANPAASGADHQDESRDSSLLTSPQHLD